MAVEQSKAPSDRAVASNPEKLSVMVTRCTVMDGLSAGSIEAAAEAAAQRDHPGQWAFTLHKPSLIPFLQFSTQRDLREKMYKGYTNIGNNGAESDNNAIASRMAGP